MMHLALATRTGHILLVIGLVACGKGPSSRPADTSKSADSTEQAPVAASSKTPGAVPLPSLARTDWPCRAEGMLPRLEARTVRTYDYTDAPPSCLHAPDDWFPGCPRAIEAKNVELGIAMPSARTYDARGRVVMAQDGRTDGIEIKWTDDGKVSSQGPQRFYQLDPRTVIVQSDEHSLDTRIEIDDRKRPLRVHSYALAKEPWATQYYTYEGARLATYRVVEHGDTAVDLKFVYDCDQK